MSPTVLRVGGYRFYFFSSREEPRAHVHVQHADGQAKFWLEPKVALAQNYDLSGRQVSTALRLVRNMKTKSALRGMSASAVEVSNLGPDGFWLLMDERELFVPFKEFPWFQDATIREITSVERPSPHHLRWPDLDIDLAVESIENPARFPLRSEVRPRPPSRRSESSRPRSKKGAKGPSRPGLR